MLSDVEISRSLNALSTTLRDQRPQRFDPERVEQIVRGALGGEAKLRAQVRGEHSGELLSAADGRLVAQVELKEGQWRVLRKLLAGESKWALPEPAHAHYERDQRERGG